jgi:hypothetical protein
MVQESPHIVGIKFNFGGVEFEIDPVSVVKNDDIVKALPPESIEKLGAAYGVRVGQGQPPSSLLLMVRSHVQNDWYMATKGEVPMATAQKHTKREEEIQKTAKESGGEEGATPARRREQRKLALDGKWKFKELTEEQQQQLGKVRGQTQIVAQALIKSKKGATPNELAEAVKGNFPTKFTDIPGSMLYHLKRLKEMGLVEPVEVQP